MEPLRQLSPTLVRRCLFLVFTISGFAGLIYESIWSHYLKLLLGHAAYAQTLVLVLFMGGMAIGAWLCARLSNRIRNPLLAYAVVELVLGFLALGFDPTFRAVFDWVLNSAAPALARPLPIEALKWGVSALMILPACVLLGATFPLISAGVVRLAPREAGNALGWLYFSNSLGAVIGVLSSGFVLIAWIGLPGTLRTAGLCNFLLAVIVYAILQRASVPAEPAATGSTANDSGAAASRILLAVAFLTGTASFFYEIGWIRMLSLVLGSATHSFELMLGAFILGLALGALYIRNRIDGIADPLRLLAWVQVLMGTAALGTLVVYGWSFDWMGAIVHTVAKTETGFIWFNVLSQAICWALMLPVTFFAGMTLPLITALLLRQRTGESAIGHVYAANTWGAIAGIVLAVHLAMPMLGLRNVVVVGALIDIGLGLFLFFRAGGGFNRAEKLALAGMMILALGIAAFVRFDASRLASGVYRYGKAARAGESIMHRDGRTASIDVVRSAGGNTISIMTNGKPDASLNKKSATADDYTMILTGVLPLALRPDAKKIAIVGMGSGRSTHVFLGAPDVETVDTIEIEPAMVEGARLFGPLVERTFTDPRSRIHIEDAKTFFARHQQQYDIIMSEPSNPWVSGVASLFTREYYRQVKTHITPGGVFVQWLQLYEFDDRLVASVLAALESEFADYAIYIADEIDVLIAAVPTGTVPSPDGNVLRLPGIEALAASIGVRSVDDLRIRRLGTRADIRAYLRARQAPANSDFFPFLDQRAAKYRFMQRRAEGLTKAHPVLHRLSDNAVNYRLVTRTPAVPPTMFAEDGRLLAAYLEAKHSGGGLGVPSAPRQVIELALGIDGIMVRCEAREVDAVWKDALAKIAQTHWAYLDPQDATRITATLRRNVCDEPTRHAVTSWLDLLDAVSARNWERVSELGLGLATAYKASKLASPPFLQRELLLADYIRGHTTDLPIHAGLPGTDVQGDPSIDYLRDVLRGKRVSTP